MVENFLSLCLLLDNSILSLLLGHFRLKLALLIQNGRNDINIHHLTVPGSPRGFTLTASSPTSLQASWMPPENESLNGVIISYQLVLRELRSGVETSHSTSASTTSYMWSGLHPHYSYSVSVAAATVAGNGPTVESQIQMPEAGVCVCVCGGGGVYVCLGEGGGEGESDTNA